jgi:DNA-binding NarL/FixJ family response regulator
MQRRLLPGLDDVRITKRDCYNEYGMLEDAITVLISDPHPLFCEGLRKRLEYLDEFKVVGEVSANRTLLSACEKHRPKVVVLNISSPTPDELGLLARLRKVSPEIQILVASDNTAPIDVQVALSEGAAGYILKSAPCEEFINAIRVIARKGCYLPQSLVSHLIEAAKKTLSTGNMFGLTRRELDILKEITLGACNKDIARKLTISVRTVEAHRKNIRQKTGVFATTDLVKIANRLGLSQDFSKSSQCI